MSFTASGPILILLVIYVFFIKPSRLAYYAAFFAPFSATALINFASVGYKAGGLGLTPAMAFTGLTLVSYLLYGFFARKQHLSLGHLMQIGLITLLICYNIFVLLLNGSQHPISSYQITQTTYLFIGLLATILFSLEFNLEGGIDAAVRAIRASAIFVSFWGFVQLVCGVAHLPYPSVLFNNSNSDAADMFSQEVASSLPRIASVAVEPSVMAASLLHFAAFGATIILYEPKMRTRYWIIPTLLTFCILALSTSSTAYIGIFALFILLLLSRPRVFLLVALPFGVAFAILAALVPKVLDILLNATINKTTTFSYLERMSGAARDLAQFYRQPLFGFGWGAAANFNSFFTLLCNVGIFGTVLFIICLLYSLIALQLAGDGSASQSWTLKAYSKGLQNALVVAGVCSVSSGIKYVFLDDFVFWALAIAVASTLDRHVASESSQSIPCQNSSSTPSAVGAAN